MNEQDSVPPPLPDSPTPAGTRSYSPAREPEPLGTGPEDHVPIRGLFSMVEALLRQPRRVWFQLCRPEAGYHVLTMLMVGVLCNAAYGLVAGTFSGGPQLRAAPVKIAGGLLCAGLICLPSLYIFSCLGGARARLIEVTGLVAGLLALLSILLVGFAPVAWVFSQSTESVVVMGSLHLVFGLVAGFFGLRFLRAGFSHFSAQRRAGLNCWVVIFLLVALQMTTALRPIVGRADQLLPAEKKFFVSYWGECLKAAVESTARPH